jgi:hypothetical protein
MARFKGGRPKLAPNGDRSTGTKMVRINADLVNMLSWIARLESISTAQLIDPLIRGPVEARFKLIEKEVAEIKLQEEKVHRLEAAASRRLRDSNAG